MAASDSSRRGAETSGPPVVAAASPGPAGRITLSGVYPALVTPFRNGAVDRNACRKLVDHVVEGGVNGVLVLGSSGEGAALTQRMRRHVADAVALALDGRLPHVVGVITSSLAVAITDARHAATTGAIAVLAAPPHYGPVDGEALLSFYRALAAASELPVLAYNIPAFTRVPIPPAIVETLAREGAIAGIKDSSRDFDYFQDVLTRLDDHAGFCALTGTDSLLVPAQVAGAHGGITIGANLVPGWCVQAWSAAAAGRMEEAKSIQRRLVRLSAAIRRGPFPAGMKGALELLGLCRRELASPRPALGDDQLGGLAAQLESLAILPPAVLTAARGASNGGGQ